MHFYWGIQSTGQKSHGANTSCKPSPCPRETSFKDYLKSDVFKYNIIHRSIRSRKSFVWITVYFILLHFFTCSIARHAKEKPPRAEILCTEVVRKKTLSLLSTYYTSMWYKSQAHRLQSQEDIVFNHITLPGSGVTICCSSASLHKQCALASPWQSSVQLEARPQRS